MKNTPEVNEALDALLFARERSQRAAMHVVDAAVDARLAGSTWTAIGRILNMSRQAAQKQYATLVAMRRHDAQCNESNPWEAPRPPIDCHNGDCDGIAHAFNDTNTEWPRNGWGTPLDGPLFLEGK